MIKRIYKIRYSKIYKTIDIKIKCIGPMRGIYDGTWVIITLVSVLGNHFDYHTLARTSLAYFAGDYSNGFARLATESPATAPTWFRNIWRPCDNQLISIRDGKCIEISMEIYAATYHRANVLKQILNRAAAARNAVIKNTAALIIHATFH